MMDPIFLTGFMGAGKTTVGKALGKRLALSVFDTDELIEAALAKSISEIFQEDGEEVFRQYETNVLKKVTWDNVIVTTGGGIVMRDENRKWMRKNGTVIYLHCDADELYRRLVHDTERPLIQNKNQAEMTALLERRLPMYQEAHITINTKGITLNETVEQIAELLINEEVSGL